MNFESTPIKDVWVISPSKHGDARGYFSETFRADLFKKQTGLDVFFCQDNESLSEEEGTLRGLHFQNAPYAQSKLVRVMEGRIFDVAVDLRPDSKTYGKWYGIELSEENGKQLFIPRGFAHGFCTLRQHTKVAYKVDAYYSKEHDAGILWKDPQLKIDWPVQNPILSAKDENLPIWIKA